MIRSLIFLNCGGSIDLTREWFYASEECRAQAYLIDSHRPYWHLNVIDENKKIYVIHDGCKSFSECPTEEDARILNDLQGDDSEDDDDDSDSEEQYGSQENGQEGDKVAEAIQ